MLWDETRLMIVAEALVPECTSHSAEEADADSSDTPLLEGESEDADLDAAQVAADASFGYNERFNGSDVNENDGRARCPTERNDATLAGSSCCSDTASNCAGRY
jgi:hypothetical protein